MVRKRIHCLTLRLDPQLDELLTEVAFDQRTSKASWIRMAIRKSLRLDFVKLGSTKRGSSEQAQENSNEQHYN